MRFWSVLLSTMATEILQVKKLSEYAVLPLRGSEFAAGTIVMILCIGQYAAYYAFIIRILLFAGRFRSLLCI
jgi:hypothetical protein